MDNSTLVLIYAIVSSFFQSGWRAAGGRAEGRIKMISQNTFLLIFRHFEEILFCSYMCAIVGGGGGWPRWSAAATAADVAPAAIAAAAW